MSWQEYVSLPSVVDQQRRAYARMKAREIIAALSGSHDPEGYLGSKLDSILHEYGASLEELSRHFERISYAAIMVQPPSILTKKGNAMQRLKPNGTAPTASPERDMYRVRDVAERLSLTYRTVHRAIRSGRVKAIRCGGAVLIPKAEFERIVTRGF